VKDNLFLATGVQKCAYRLTRAFVGLGSLVCEIVQTAVHVGIFLGVSLLQSVEDLPGFCAEAALSR
jgi:hypothetical protein